MYKVFWAEIQLVTDRGLSVVRLCRTLYQDLLVENDRFGEQVVFPHLGGDGYVSCGYVAFVVR